MSRSPRLTVPKEQGAHLSHPPLEKIPDLLQSNRQALTQIPGDVLGRSWSELQSLAREEVLASCERYLQSNRESMPETKATHVVMTGHQPELFHPGVWVKNFALNWIASQLQTLPVNLIVDNDVIKSNALRVPPSTNPLPPLNDFVPRSRCIYFSESLLGVPYEEGILTGEDLFRSVPERVNQSWGWEPLLTQFWERACSQSSDNVGERFAFARRSLEREWGCHNAEVRVSDLCQTEAFAWFACHLITNLKNFHKAHNGSLHDHRREQGIRNRSRPIADLQQDQDWLEAPFWAWKRGSRQRQRLWVRFSATGIELRAGEEVWPVLPEKVEHLVKAFRDLESGGLKVRSRALTNTIFQRLFVADLFIHGIGGGKYDEVTDEMIRRFYQVNPPGFVILTGTLRLPMNYYPNDGEDARELTQRLRDLQHNPQRYSHLFRTDPLAKNFADQKRAWIERTDRPALTRWQTLRSLTEELLPSVADYRARLEQKLSQAFSQQRANAYLSRRDFAFCLYPGAMLRSFCVSFLHGRQQPFAVTSEENQDQRQSLSTSTSHS